MSFQKIEYQVADLSEAPQLLEIAASGEARYRSHTNETTPNLSEIGTYETTLSRNEIQAIENLLGAVPLATVRDHTGRVLSGERYRRLRVTLAGGVIEKLTGTRQPVDLGLQRVLAGLDQVIDRVRLHRRQVLHIDVGVPVMKDAAELTLPIKLSNTGTEGLLCANPTLLSGSENGSLSVEVWPSANSSELRTAQPTRVENESAPTSSGEKTLALAPGATAGFRLLVPIAAVRGREYSLRVKYSTTVDKIKGRDVIKGDLFGRIARLTVP